MNEKATVRRTTLLRVLAVCLSASVVWNVTSAAPPSEDVKEFVTRSYVHGVPYREAHAYGPAAVPDLVAMMNDSRFEEHWTNVVWVLGCIGDPSATGPLLEFLNSRRGEQSPSAFRAMLAVLPALGHLVRAGDRRASATLVEFTRPREKGRAATAFSYGSYRGEALHDLLARTAIQGLGIAGTPETRRTLQALRVQPGLPAEWRGNIDEAIRFNQRVEQETAERVFGAEGRP